MYKCLFMFFYKAYPLRLYNFQEKLYVTAWESDIIFLNNFKLICCKFGQMCMLGQDTGDLDLGTLGQGSGGLGLGKYFCTTVATKKLSLILHVQD